MEVYFRPLLPEEIGRIAEDAVQKIGFSPCPEAVDVVKRYATNGREAVNIIQLAAGLALTEKRETLQASDVEWVAGSSQIQPRPDRKVPLQPQIGFVNGLAVYGPNMGTILEIEVSAVPALRDQGRINITGVVDEEEIGGGSRTLRRKSMAKGSVENVLTVLKAMGIRPNDYDLHVNFPGGTPIDGPSAGIAMATAITSAIQGRPIDHETAMTGEISIHGRVKPIGGVLAKVEAAFQAGAKTVIIPAENWQSIFENLDGLRVIPVDTVEDVFREVFDWVPNEEQTKQLNLAEESATPAPEIFPPASASYLRADLPRPGQVTDSGSC
jgi:Lon-like ATP-dependent protease